MKRWMAFVGVVACCGCNSSPTAPPPQFVGNYAFVVEASSVCQLPVSRYNWDLVATPAGGAGSFRMTLPAGDPTLSLTLGYQQSGGGRSGPVNQIFNINMNVQGVPFGDLLVTINGNARGTAAYTTELRGVVPDGAINGTIRLQERGQRPAPPVSCTAGDHRFTLTPQ